MGGYALTAILLVPMALPAAQYSQGEHPRTFAGARGFGVRSVAGRGGRLIRVTNLNPEGPGSLREALAARGPRLVVFEVGGVLDLNLKGLVVSEPYLTLAGQTAPSPGITLIRGGLSIRTHDVLIRHLRVRMGDAGQKKKSGWEPEVGLRGADAYNVVLDHCSLSWGIEDILSVAGAATAAPQSPAQFRS